MELNTSEAMPAPNNIHHERLCNRSRMSSFKELRVSFIGFTLSLVQAKQQKNRMAHMMAITTTAISHPYCLSAMSASFPEKAFAMGMNSSKAMKLPT